MHTSFLWVLGNCSLVWTKITQEMTNTNKLRYVQPLLSHAPFKTSLLQINFLIFINPERATTMYILGAIYISNMLFIIILARILKNCGAIWPQIWSLAKDLQNVFYFVFFFGFKCPYVHSRHYKWLYLAEFGEFDLKPESNKLQNL